MLAVEIERTWSEVQEAHAQILLMQRSVASATENLRQNRNFYDAGTATLTDLLDAETLYTQSRNNLTSAYAAYHTSLAEIHARHGALRGGAGSTPRRQDEEAARQVPETKTTPDRRLLRRGWNRIKTGL